MTINKDNIIGGLIGALIALLLKALFDRFNVAMKLNRIRKVILDYSTFIGLDKSGQYILDMDYISRYIKAKTVEEISKCEQENYAVDAMPMFTSDIFKSFPQDELRRVCYDSENYIRVIDIMYSTNFLKEYLPLQLYDKYHIKVRKHMEEDKIPLKDEIKHFQECGYLKSLEDEAIREINMKIERAKLTHAQFHTLIDNLKGYGLVWVIKYIIKQ